MLETPELIQKEVFRRLSDLEKAPVLQQHKLLKGKQLKLEEESNRLLDAYQNDCINLPELKQRMDVIKRERNNLARALEETASGVSKKQLLELNEAVAYFSSHLQSSEEKLGIEEKRKILRMLIRGIQIGNDEIVIDHIIPLKKKPLSNKNALLCPHRNGVNLKKRFATRLEPPSGHGPLISNGLHGVVSNDKLEFIGFWWCNRSFVAPPVHHISFLRVKK